MPDRQELEALRSRYQQDQRDLAVAERDVKDAEEGLQALDQELRDLGFDPTADLEAQLAKKEKELAAILDDVEQHLTAGEALLTQQPDE